MSHAKPSPAYIPETAFGDWFLQTPTWDVHVLEVALRDLDPMLAAGNAAYLGVPLAGPEGAPLGTVRDLYAHFELELSAAAEEAMRVWISASPTSRHGEHRYDGNRFGITDADIHDAFGDYRARFKFN